MPRLFTKGNPGKPKGAKNKKTLVWEELGDFFTTEGAERAKSIMMRSNDERFMEHYKNLIELFKPKLARTETNLSGSINMTPPIINVKPAS